MVKIINTFMIYRSSQNQILSVFFMKKTHVISKKKKIKKIHNLRYFDRYFMLKLGRNYMMKQIVTVLVISL